jgi:hypothetical protein
MQPAHTAFIVLLLVVPPLARAEPLPPSMTSTEAPSAIAARDRSEKPGTMERQRRTLEQRYDLSDRPRAGVMMSGGRKAVQQGVRVRLTLEDTVEFFNLVLGIRLTADEKDALTQYLLTL